jgi:hypothetical protein
MTVTQSPLLRLVAVAGWCIGMAGCAGVAANGASSLPDSVIVNDPAKGPATEASEAPALPIPALSAPMHDELPAEPIVHGDVFDRIRGRLALPEVEHRRIQSEIAWFQRNPDYLERTFGRGQRYVLGHRPVRRVKLQRGR